MSSRERGGVDAADETVRLVRRRYLRAILSSLELGRMNAAVWAQSRQAIRRSFRRRSGR